MQTKHFAILLFLLVTKVLAGGYQGALERTLGWKCINWDTVTEECKPGKNGRSGCQLTNFLGGTGRDDPFMADSEGNTLPLTDEHPDPEETAKRLLTHYLAQPKHKVPNWAGHKFIKGGDKDYVRSLRRIGNLVATAGTDGKNTGINKALFEMFASTTTQIKNARIGDTGPFLVTRAENELNPRGITVYTESISPGHMSQAVASGKFTKGQVMQITAEVRSEYYRGIKKANDHRVVIKAFKTAETKAKGCL
ncbi:hypothetical protein GGR55DRAFT_691536 [Xylaria sp. FL0064]|nr:hypothetical protein GGR55DRAFT_691536 [Xylaria sp. FL0064]